MFAFMLWLCYIHLLVLVLLFQILWDLLHTRSYCLWIKRVYTYRFLLWPFIVFLSPAFLHRLGRPAQCYTDWPHLWSLGNVIDTSPQAVMLSEVFLTHALLSDSWNFHLSLIYGSFESKSHGCWILLLLFPHQFKQAYYFLFYYVTWWIKPIDFQRLSQACSLGINSLVTEYHSFCKCSIWFVNVFQYVVGLLSVGILVSNPLFRNVFVIGVVHTS